MQKWKFRVRAPRERRETGADRADSAGYFVARPPERPLQPRTVNPVHL